MELQTAVIEAVSRRLDELAPANRPRIVQFGESLGAQVAVDVAGPEGIPQFDAVGLESGLYSAYRSAVTCGRPIPMMLTR